MTMISAWLEAEEPDRSESVTFYLPGRLAWYRPGPITPREREIICRSVELNLSALVETELEEEFGSID